MKIFNFLLFSMAMGLGQLLNGQPGNLDPTFATMGRFYFATTPAYYGGTNGVAIYPGGKIVLGAYTYTAGNYDILIARLDAVGHLDKTFGTPDPFGVPQGFTVVPLSRDQFTSSVVVQPDGKILVGGWSQKSSGASAEEGNFLLMRFTADGHLDTSFGFGMGYVESDLMGHAGWDVAQGLAIDSDGNIIQAGFSYTAPPATQPACISVVKYLPNGDLNTAFNGVGMKKFCITNGVDIGTAVVVRGQAEIVVGGYVNAGPSSNSGVLAMQLKPNGDLEPSFGAGGLAIYYDVPPFFIGPKFIHAMVLQPDGKLVLAGNMSLLPSTNEDMLVVRLLGNGNLDNTFGPTGFGMVLVPFGTGFDRGRGVGLDSHQNILVGGYTDLVAPVFDVDWALACLQSDGSLHPGFGIGGKVTTNMLPSAINSLDYVHALAVQPDDKIVMVGDQDQTVIAAARYNGHLVGAVSSELPPLPINVYPNPLTSNNIRLEYEVPCSGQVLFRLLDVNGKVIKVLSVKTVPKGPQIQQLVLPQDAFNGIKFLHIRSECGEGVVKLVGRL